MSVSLYQIKRWFNMLRGKSIYHVRQDIGKIYATDSIGGYYNDMTKKVIDGEKSLENGLPVLQLSDGSRVQFPTMIFQYGLGAYDLWLLSEKTNADYYERFTRCADWALENQMESGAWNTFSFLYPDHPYSAMPQGEGTSLLLRMYVQTKNDVWLKAAQKAIDFMLTDVEAGGVSRVNEKELILLEYTHKPAVLNGWIFALWGLWDFLQVCKEERYKQAFVKGLSTLEQTLSSFDGAYWSMYNLGGLIASPFYHNLHISQMQAMYRLTGREVFQHYVDKWTKDQNSWWHRRKAFLKKALQKIVEK